MKTLYSIEALAIGDGRNGSVTTSDGALALDLSRPPTMGGDGKGFNPEQLFAAGYSACFHSALIGAGKERKIEVGDSSVGVRVELVRDEEGGGVQLSVRLEVILPDVDPVIAHELAEAAHARCPYSKALRGDVLVELTVAED